MVSKINSGYMKAVGRAITNFSRTLPDYQSDLAQCAFKDPYNFSFIGTMALQHERDIENRLAERMTEFLLELGHGFAYVGRQYNVVVDGDDYYIDILMYHLKLHCYVVVELKAIEFIPDSSGSIFRAKLLRPVGTPSAALLSVSDSTLVFCFLVAAVLDLHEKRPALPKC